MRGKYKQLFLRVLDDGQHVCQPANLKVTPERTLEIFVEDVSWISCPMAYSYIESPLPRNVLTRPLPESPSSRHGPHARRSAPYPKLAPSRPPYAHHGLDDFDGNFMMN